MAKAMSEMTNDELLAFIDGLTVGEKATIVFMIDKELDKPFTLGNKVAREGCDRCYCGCKYWENDRCIDCGTDINSIPEMER